ncbi:trypsin-like peptidase domain-containing protein [Serratia entomophila]|uniref:Trypsin-like peptidase domain-containing protein n=1 Tax=Serratia entomophila TaxID=42906 RepID=A0ABY5D008_9GAMM|nr:trypsin-like peptidase domain-containing protein [Serratia entomophila]USV03039.1 trypsin-like peptidase domain-containing protein [Serratia entomophila]CAI0696481.1 Uncharacterised protein [Serratia entomophila]CAI0798176.1 Uncharacterised protein [Serratia entomophila]CAI0827289.1 Uncharacterised protein [Serratia entomophila]CAI0851764.1 Uncharacterised protein [Serratia entomophila]
MDTPKTSVVSFKSIYLEMMFEDNVLSKGTGFITKTKFGDVIVTNRHNVTGKDQNTGKHLSSTLGEPDRIAVHFFCMCDDGINVKTEKHIIKIKNNGSALWLEHPVLKEKADVVIIPIINYKLDIPHYFKYEISTRKLDVHDPEEGIMTNGSLPLSVDVADRVSIIGYPYGKRINNTLPIWLSGYIASEPYVNYDNLPVFLVDARTRKGQSGSPVVKVTSGGMDRLEASENISHATFNPGCIRFLGIYSGRLSEESDIGMVWKSSCILGIVNYYEMILEASIRKLIP